MLRAGPLSSPGIMEKLGRDFVNAWVLINDLPRIVEEAKDPHVRALAERAKKNYNCPVDSQLYTPAGELIEHLNANVVLRGDAETCYARFLEAPWREGGATSDDLSVVGPDGRKNKIVRPLEEKRRKESGDGQKPPQ